MRARGSWLLALAVVVAPAAAGAQPGAAAAEMSAEADEELAGAAPAAATTPARSVEPVVNIAGGFRFEQLQRRQGETAQARHPTVAVSQLGVRGRLGDRIAFASVFEANLGGARGYGASVWEGQAQLSVLDQYVSYRRGRMTASVGRMVDESTLNFLSAHSLGLMGRDFYVRNFVIYSGSDAGTGVQARYEVGGGLTAGLTFRSTNPTGLTGTFVIGGELFPFDRPFSLAAAQVGRSADKLPDHNLHVYFVTPSLTYSDSLLDARAAVQLYELDTQMSTSSDQPIRGFNVRAGLRARLAGGRIVPFVNASLNRNERIDPLDATQKLDGFYQVRTLSGGVDAFVRGASGIGLQYGQIFQREGAGRVRDHFMNLGGTLALDAHLSVALRLGWFVRDDAAETAMFGHRSVFVTGLLAL